MLSEQTWPVWECIQKNSVPSFGVALLQSKCNSLKGSKAPTNAQRIPEAHCTYSRDFHSSKGPAGWHTAQGTEPWRELLPWRQGPQGGLTAECCPQSPITQASRAPLPLKGLLESTCPAHAMKPCRKPSASGLFSHETAASRNGPLCLTLVIRG